MRVFKEEQRFTQKWLIILLVATTIPPTIIITKEFIDNKISSLYYISIIGILLIATGSIFTFKLKTKIDEIGIHYQFFPFHFKMKTILWENIKEAKLRKYDALSEYGGWGLKGGWLWNIENGKAINVKGNIGIQLTLDNNKKLLIGTQNKNNVDTIINRYLHKN